jgi:hypothetical protein
MTDDDLQEAAYGIAAEQQRPKEKLPRARSYLHAARWGFWQMVKERHVGAPVIFHLAAIAAVARAVPDVLIRADCQLSDAHKAVIGEWRARTKPATTPVIHFLKTIRDLALHEGKLNSYAIWSELRHGEGHNEIIISSDYDVARYDEQGDRHDVLAELRWAFDWLETELRRIEAQLPPRD